MSGLLLVCLTGRFVPWFLLARFGRIGSEGFGSGFGVGAKGLVGGAGRFIGVLGSCLDVAGEMIFVWLFVLIAIIQITSGLALLLLLLYQVTS